MLPCSAPREGASFVMELLEQAWVTKAAVLQQLTALLAQTVLLRAAVAEQRLTLASGDPELFHLATVLTELVVVETEQVVNLVVVSHLVSVVWATAFGRWRHGVVRPRPS